MTDLPISSASRGSRATGSYVSLALVAAFLLITAVPELRLSWLVDNQQHKSFKIMTGLALVGFLAYQWGLFFARTFFGWLSRRGQRGHQWVGVIGPILLTVHSVHLGYGYRALLCAIFLSNIAVGAINPDLVRPRSPLFVRVWFALHMALATALLFLVGYHSLVALSY